MKMTVEISREALLGMVVDGIVGELNICADQVKSPKLQLSKTSRGQHILTFDTQEQSRVDEKP